MTRRHFEERLAVILRAPRSLYDGHQGHVDPHELHTARKRDAVLTVYFDSDCSTIAFADELEMVDPTPPGTPSDNRDRRTP